MRLLILILIFDLSKSRVEERTLTNSVHFFRNIEHDSKRCFVRNSGQELSCLKYTVAEFKEFERRFKFKSRFKYGWFHLKLYQMFQDLSRR